MSQFVMPAVLLCILFLSAFLRDVPLAEGILSDCRNEVNATFDVSSQYIWCGVLTSYCFILAMLNWKRFPPRRIKLSGLWRPAERDAIWISSLLVFCVLIYALARYWLQYEQAGRDTDALVLLFCVLLNQWLIWMMRECDRDAANRFRSRFVGAFILLGCLCLLMSPLNPKPNVLFDGPFLYHGRIRWTAIWQSPNAFGFLMAVIFMLSIGRAWQAARRARDASWALYLLPVAISGVCVVKSYSRGAWISTLCGVSFLIWNGFGRRPAGKDHPAFAGQPRLAKNVFLCVMVGMIVGLSLGFGLKRLSHLQIPIVQRAVSAFGKRDFSSLNRIASYQDGINMLMDHPMAGYGWEDVVAIHTALYLQPGLTDGSPLKLNDFLMLALRLGLPMFAIFLLFIRVWLSAGTRNKEFTAQNGRHDILLCRMATMMFAVGFLFTDGLFRLTFGGSFWLFLTLSFDFGAITPPPIRAEVMEPIESIATIPGKWSAVQLQKPARDVSNFTLPAV